MWTRRSVLNLAAQAAGYAGLACRNPVCVAAEAAVFVNDVHSQLNETRVAQIASPRAVEECQDIIATAVSKGAPVAIAGGRHSMGGQQFATDGVLIDMRAMNRIIALDTERGLVEVEAGIEWPKLIEGLNGMQAGVARPYGIIQKQTGADRLTIGGALTSNIHGRGLKFKPFIGDIESFKILIASGDLLTCSRSTNSELFRLAVGGYGLFGIVTSVTIRLMPRTKLKRVVEIIDIDNLEQAFAQRIAAGYLYGDCQFSTDVHSDRFLRAGVFSCYMPLAPDADMPAERRELHEGDWRKLYYLSHADPARAYDAYSSYYLTTSGQHYWSDTHQLSEYIDGYHALLDKQLGATAKGSEMITELYVPRGALSAFLASVREDFRRNGTRLIYGTIRLIEKDDESFLAWAREPWACTVMNLHIDHTDEGIIRAADDFRKLIDRAIEFGGSYFLTYHRWARADQVENCYPQMVEFLRQKKQHDPHEVFTSDWYRHYRSMLVDRL